MGGLQGNVKNPVWFPSAVSGPLPNFVPRASFRGLRRDVREDSQSEESGPKRDRRQGNFDDLEHDRVLHLDDFTLWKARDNECAASHSRAHGRGPALRISEQNG